MRIVPVGSLAVLKRSACGQFHGVVRHAETAVDIEDGLLRGWLRLDDKALLALWVRHGFKTSDQVITDMSLTLSKGLSLRSAVSTATGSNSRACKLPRVARSMHFLDPLR